MHSSSRVKTERFESRLCITWISAGGITAGLLANTHAIANMFSEAISSRLWTRNSTSASRPSTLLHSRSSPDGEKTGWPLETCRSKYVLLFQTWPTYYTYAIGLGAFLILYDPFFFRLKGSWLRNEKQGAAAMVSGHNKMKPGARRSRESERRLAFQCTIRSVYVEYSIQRSSVPSRQR